MQPAERGNREDAGAHMPHPQWFTSPRLPSAEECSIPAQLVRRAARAPNAPCAMFADEAPWTNAEALAIAEEYAAGLAALGLRPGARLINALPNGAAHLRVLFGATLLGVTPAPLNPSLRGNFLADALHAIRPHAIAVHAEMLKTSADLLSSCAVPIIAFGSASGAGGVIVSENALRGKSAKRADPLPEPWELAALMMTSGTTGPTKAVRVTNAQLWSIARAHFGYLCEADRMMISTPLSHVGPLSGLVGALVHDSSMAISESFRTPTFWDDVRRFGATAIPGLGPSLLHFLNSAPPRADDADNGLRIVNVTSSDPGARAFARRFDVDFFASFGMTEISVGLISDLNTPIDGTCGRPRDGVQVRLVDEHDVEVPVNEIGEIVLRPDLPWVFTEGYEGNPEATASAWRNGWFHTGDTARRDADGNFYFADRIKDVIRRRGENISSLEVERELLAHPDVRDAAAVAVPSEHGDQEILAVISTRPGSDVDPATLAAFLAKRMPAFMVPRYIRAVPELPRTGSNKIRKSVLRDEGVTADCWDRERARRERPRPQPSDIEKVAR